MFFNLQSLIREHTEELALSITTEQGKTLQDARGDVFRGLEVVESICAAGNIEAESQSWLLLFFVCGSYKQTARLSISTIIPVLFNPLSNSSIQNSSYRRLPNNGRNC